MRWLNFPPLAEFEDRFGAVRRLYGLPVLGRFEFAARMEALGKMLVDLPDDVRWHDECKKSAEFKNAIDCALKCWGLKTKWFSVGQVEALLFFRYEGEELCRGYLVEILENPPSPLGKGEPEPVAATLAETIAAIASHCANLEEAMNLAGEVLVEILGDVLKAKAGSAPATDPDAKKKDFIKQNYDKLMAMGV